MARSHALCGEPGTWRTAQIAFQQEGGWLSRRCHTPVVKPILVAVIPAAVTFAVAELICRLLLGVPDEWVPLVVLPVTFLVWALATRYLTTRGHP